MGVEEDFRNFINTYKITEKGKPYTHTSIGNPKIALNIPNDKIKQFYNLYNNARMNSIPLHLTEKPLDPSPLRVDFDFKFNLKKTENDESIVDRWEYYKFEHIITIVEEYFKILSDMVIVSKQEMWVCIMMKNSAKEDRGFLKDGVHLVFPNIILSNKAQHWIRGKILEKGHAIFGDMFLCNDANNVVDKAIIDNSGWQMYGSCKPGNQAYTVTHIFNYEDGKLTEDKEMLSDCTIQIKFVEILSMRKSMAPTKMKEGMDEKIEEYVKDILMPQKKVNNTKVEQTFLGDSLDALSTFDNDPETIKLTKRLVTECIDPSRADSYSSWIQLGWVLKNIDCRLLDCWKDFSRLSTKYVEGECDAKWDRFTKGSMSMGTLRWLAKIDNKDKYEEILTDSLYYQVDQAIVNGGAHFDIALVLQRKYGDEYKYVGKDAWYKYEPKEHR